MLTVLIPNKFRPELEYTLDVLLDTFLGLKYEINIHENSDFVFILANGNKLTIQNSFFSRFQNHEEYLHEKNIPGKVQFAVSQFSTEENIPVIYGDLEFKVSKQEISCGPDIIASSFFMLSRWEEYCIKERDQYGNFPTDRSFMVRNNLNYRPIVNEYLEFLWNMLVHLGLTEDRKQQKYQVKITHDIDNLLRFDSFHKFLKSLAGDLILRKNPKAFAQTISSYVKIKRGKLNDPFDTFDYLMDVSEENGLKSHFYFVPGMNSEEDVRYNISNKKVIDIITKISSRGHIIGLHGTYSGFKNPDQFQKELKRLTKIHPEIKEGRQHYLRFLNPDTWQIWEDAGLKYDSTIGYEFDCGFRAGVCYEYPVFNILTRKKLNLIEQPLIFMEGSMRDKYPSEEDFMNKLDALVKEVKKYNGLFVFLWHNSNINTFEWKGIGSKYSQIVKSIL